MGRGFESHSRVIEIVQLVRTIVIWIRRFESYMQFMFAFDSGLSPTDFQSVPELHSLFK